MRKQNSRIKIVGILLAVCFVLSVTAAAASAQPSQEFKKNVKQYKGKISPENYNIGKPTAKPVFKNGNWYIGGQPATTRNFGASPWGPGLPTFCTACCWVWDPWSGSWQFVCF